MRFNRFLTPLTLATCLFATGAVHAQTVGLNWNPRTGDVWVDTQLADINRYGSTYREPFIDEMVRYHGAPRDLVTDLLVNQRWSAGDVYYACTIAQIAGRPCREVADEWERNRGQGWGVVAQRLGIKPGSAEFHRLKKGFVPTYDRWARPITLDADLKRAYPNRGNAGKSKGASKGVASGHKQPARTSPGKHHSGKPSSHAAGHNPAKAPASKPKGQAAGKGGKTEQGGKGTGQGKGNGKS